MNTWKNGVRGAEPPGPHFSLLLCYTWPVPWPARAAGRRIQPGSLTSGQGGVAAVILITMNLSRFLERSARRSGGIPTSSCHAKRSRGIPAGINESGPPVVIPGHLCHCSDQFDRDSSSAAPHRNDDTGGVANQGGYAPDSVRHRDRSLERSGRRSRGIPESIRESDPPVVELERRILGFLFGCVSSIRLKKPVRLWLTGGKALNRSRPSIGMKT